MAYLESGQQGLYQDFPRGTRTSADIPGPPPSTVKNAYCLMLVGAALSVVSAIVDLGSQSARTAAEKRAELGQMTPGQVNAAVGLEYGLVIAVGLFAAGLWIWVAFANKAGRHWTAVAGTVLFGLYTLSELFALTRAASSAPATALSASGWLVGLATVILIWNKASTAYYKAQPESRYPGGAS
jgi:uncharacterized membrane protein